MKILKPGKVEQRKFTCPVCECVFVSGEVEAHNGAVACPMKGCGCSLSWKIGEPYQETAVDIRERLSGVLIEAMFEYSSTEGRVEYLIANGVTFREV